MHGYQKNTDGSVGVIDPSIRDLLIAIATDILETSVDPDLTFISQGLDSLGAMTFLETLHKHGHDADYEFILNEASVSSLATCLRPKLDAGPKPLPKNAVGKPFSLTGPQLLWANLERAGWGSWANISLCLSIPESAIAAAYLPAILQSVCDSNDAMRTVLVRGESAESPPQQQIISNFQLPVQLRDAPALVRDAMRLVQDFEGEVISPFEPSTRALILSSKTKGGRHWLCLTMHHIFSDRLSMQNIAQQIKRMIAESELRVIEPAPIGHIDYAVWQSETIDRKKIEDSRLRLQDRLKRARVSSDRAAPKPANSEALDLGDLPAAASLKPAESQALETLAVRLETTLPLLLHALFSVLVVKLTDDKEAMCGKSELILCHVVSNRERHASLKNLVGCLDTSVPVAIRLSEAESLSSLCLKTRQTFAETYPDASNLPRGGWISNDENSGDSDRWTSLFEAIPHINIVRMPGSDKEQQNVLDIQEHPVRRAQKTRWGLLLRIALPQTKNTKNEYQNSASADLSTMRVSAFAEDRQLANLSQYCFVELLRSLLNEPIEKVADLKILERVDLIVDRAGLASAQLRRTAKLVSRNADAEPFIYNKLVERQQRWYEHNSNFELVRDSENRFVGTAANPFPFTQLDKLKERQYLQELEAPLPSVLHIVPKETLAEELLQLAPGLPKSFVIKPVGAGHSFGVTIVRDGLDLTRNGSPFDMSIVATELSEMADRGYCTHEGHVFPFNFSSFLIEELVVDERGYPAPTDYKIFMVGKKHLWTQLHFKENGLTWVAFVDAQFSILAQPAWDPTVCWRTHRALICTDQAMVDARHPSCASEILAQSERLAEHMGIFVRLDWYADKERGPLIGEITTFPHMLQPRNFYTAWANDTLKAAWQNPDGVAAPIPAQATGSHQNLISHTEDILGDKKSKNVGLLSFLPAHPQAPWSVQNNISYETLRTYISEFDLAPWNVAAGARVGLLVGNGVQLGAALLATMNRYTAVPIGSAMPVDFIIAQLREAGVGALLVIAGTNEALKAREIEKIVSGIIVIELVPDSAKGVASLPTQSTETSAPKPANGPDDDVLVLRTSGSTGDPKSVTFSLARLVRSGAIIGHSLDMASADLGISMLPLHHIGGIACNLIAPLVSGSSMRFCKTFDPKLFFDTVAHPQSATWCYLVPAMWDMLLEYARGNPHLYKDKPWPRLRAIRSAGAELPHDVASELAELFGNNVSILPTYGMTEAMPIAAPSLPYKPDGSGSVGCVLPTVSVEIISISDNDMMSVVADGEVGEITVKGPTVFNGYDRTDGEAADIFTPRGYFRTGDLGSLAADGSNWLTVSGRAKDAINRGGETIAPAEIDAVLRGFPALKKSKAKVELMAFSRSHRVLGEDVAVAVAPQSANVDLAELNEWACERLPSYALPQTLVKVQNLPRSNSGKLLRTRFAETINKLWEPGVLHTQQTYTVTEDGSAAQLVSETKSQSQETVPSRTKNDATIEGVIDVVRSFVGEAVHIGPDTHLDDIGVNSLAAVELSARLNAEFNSQLPTWAISDHPTPSALLAQIAEKSVAAAQYDAAETPKAQPLRMLFLHGEAADAELMELSLKATSWSGQLDGRIEFVFMNAPHECDPKPDLHKVAVDAGLYVKDKFRSWGGKNEQTLQASIAAVKTALEEMGPFDAIGGMCDGGSVAALVASQTPELKLYFNISSSPISSLPGSKADHDWRIICPTIHLISKQDELNSYSELLEIPSHCRKAILLQHDKGHAIPALTGSLKKDIDAALGQIGVTSHSNENRPKPTVDFTDTNSSAALVSANHLQKHEAENDGAVRQEARVKQVMSEVLGHNKFGRTDDFFDIGGNSILAMDLTSRLERKYQIKIPFESLFLNGATVGVLTRIIEEKVRDFDEISVVELNKSSADEAFYVLPTVNGYVSDYLALGKVATDSARLFGLRFQVLLSNDQTQSVSIRRIAEEAADTVLKHQGDQAINLVGFSAAGVLAFETARCVIERGREVNTLVLIDTPARDAKYNWPSALKSLVYAQKETARRIRVALNAKRQKGYFALKLKAEMANWAPEPIEVNRAILFKTQDNQFGKVKHAQWQTLLKNNLELVPISGKHTGFRKPDVAQEIAQAIFKTNG